MFSILFYTFIFLIFIFIIIGPFLFHFITIFNCNYFNLILYQLFYLQILLLHSFSFQFYFDFISLQFISIQTIICVSYKINVPQTLHSVSSQQQWSVFWFRLFVVRKNATTRVDMLFVCWICLIWVSKNIRLFSEKSCVLTAVCFYCGKPCYTNNIIIFIFILFFILLTYFFIYFSFHSQFDLSLILIQHDEIFVDGWYLCGEIVPHQVLLDQSELQTNLWPDFHLSRVLTVRRSK